MISLITRADETVNGANSEMAKLSNRSRIEQLTDKFEPQLKLAFLDAVADITKRAELKRIVERLERGDIPGAIDAVHLDPAAFRTLDNAIAAAFDGGGASAVGALPKLTDPQGNRFVVRWDARNLRAEAWLRNHSSTLITRITEDMRTSVRTVLEQGLIDGRNPRSTALDVIGRINRATGRREGGIVGLTSQQSGYVSNALAELSSADPDVMANYFTRVRRDRRFDAAVRKAMNEGRAIDAELRSRIIGRYSDRLLQLRGETIARTETMAALNQSGIEAMRQAVDTGAVKADTVTKVWHTARDPRVRDSHADQDRQSVGLEGAFSNGLMYPGDPAGGAHETSNCRCWMETRIDFTAGLIEEELALAGLT